MIAATREYRSDGFRYAGTGNRTRGNPIGYPCPHYAAMRESVVRALGPDVLIIDYTH